MFALVDANAFYCSAEQVFRPDWRGKPVVVLSNNDGMIVSMNRQAKELGIPKFTPYFQIKDQCEEKGVIALSSNYELYSDLSAKMMQVIGRFSPEQFVYSIDESFLSFKRMYPAVPCLRAHALNLRKAVWKECRLPVCVGIASTLTLTKVANHMAKKQKHLNGVCYLSDPHVVRECLKNVPINEIWGVGKKLSEKMKFMGMVTAYDLAKQSPFLLRKEFSIEVERINRELNGQSCKGWDVVKADQKQIFSTRSVTQRITDIESLRQVLIKHAGIASRKAREQHSISRVMVSFAQSSSHEEKPYSAKAIHRFTFPTADIGYLTKIASEQAEQLFKEKVRFYKIGVGLLDLTTSEHEQFDLLNENPTNDKLNHVFDMINRKYGTDTLFIAGQGIDEGWSMKRDLLTKQYTSRWKDIPKIRC